MGLDIVAANRVVYVTDDYDHDCDDACHFFVCDDDDFPARHSDVKNGVYHCPPGVEPFSFRAGSYSFYNDWRRHLSLMALGFEPEYVWAFPDLFGPFVELIHFSDCQGVFGPAASRKLAEDFQAF